MIVLQCTVCGHEIAVSESLRDVSIRCARCGHLLAAKAAFDPAKTEIAPRPPLDDPGHGEAAAPTSHPGNEETLAPNIAARPVSFTFLSAAKGPDELGWLGHYRVLRLLGQGGMGLVFEAVDMNLERSVALKVMKPESAQDEGARQRFLREARALAAVRSDHVVTVHEVGEANHLPFLAMEFLHGAPLDAWLRRRGRPSVAEILRLGTEISRGLAAAHSRGLIHRDIKPGNVFLEAKADGGNEADSFRVKILDFGLARTAADRSKLTDPGRVIGTPGYMAPEQVEGMAVDARSDLFSLGCILYELSTGVQPFEASSAVAILMAVLNREPTPPGRLNPELPSALGHLIVQLMAKEPGRRPESAGAVADALEALGVRGTRPTAREDAARRNLLGTLVLLAVLAGAAFGLAWWLWLK